MTPLAPFPGVAIAIVWTVWVASWLLAAVWSRQTVARPDIGRQLPDRLVTALGAVIMFTSMTPRSHTNFPIEWDLPEPARWVLFGCVVAGMAFAWWARLHLGKLWSGWVVRKEGHRIVDTGPYAIVRHPIYTGLIAATLVTAIAAATLPALAGFALIASGLWLKARFEEEFLRQELGPEAYDAYRRRVPMLLPFGPRQA